MHSSSPSPPRADQSRPCFSCKGALFLGAVEKQYAAGCAISKGDGEGDHVGEINGKAQSSDNNLLSGSLDEVVFKIVAVNNTGPLAVQPPLRRGCEECLRSGDTWVHLRLCLMCGHVGCCDSSKNKHATKHFWSMQHPIASSLEPGEDWRWCYVDEIAV